MLLRRLVLCSRGVSKQQGTGYALHEEVVNGGRTSTAAVVLGAHERDVTNPKLPVGRHCFRVSGRS